MDRLWKIILGTAVLATLAATGCASSGGMGQGDKVWMRDGSTYGAQEAKDRCQPEDLTQTDFHMCMQSNGYSLETPPAQ